MKKIPFALAFIIGVFLSAHLTAFATAALPANNIWVSPANAAQGSDIMLNALVYNNTSTDATVTVTFTTDQKVVIGSIKQLVTSESAKTLAQPWLMPKNATVVTGAIVSAVDKNNKSIPSLVGTLGTITVGTDAVAPVLTGITFPGSGQLSAWFGPYLAKVEAWRANQATYFTNLEATTKKQLDISQAPTTTTTDGIAPLKFDNPWQWVTVIYATAMTGLFSNVILFYIAAVLVIMLILRFIVNLIF